MTKRDQFVRLFDKPRVYRSDFFQAYFKENSLKYSRLGVTIKGRLKSVHRMKIKRIVREWFRAVKDRIGNQDLNIVIKVPSEIRHDFFIHLNAKLQKWKS
jgi:ribonuclease P protein component